MQNDIAISIVEDQDEIREGLQRIISETPGFICLSAHSNAETALKELPELMPDIVIMDINLPGMDGIECIKKVKLVCPGMQFMMFTIYENNEQVFDALAAGASGYLLKKTPRDKIVEAIQELHQGGSPMSTQIARKVVASFRQNQFNADEAAKISPREMEILNLLSKGFLYKEIGEKLAISTGTVKQHIHKIYDKLHVENRTEALNKVFGRNNG